MTRSWVTGGIAILAIAGCGMKKMDKKSEAELNLQAVQKKIMGNQANVPGFPVGDSGETPGTPCCDSGRADKKCEADPTLWEGNEIWDQLDFEISSPGHFRYHYVAPDDDHMTMRAIGDLDCDGDEVEWVLTGEMVDGKPMFSVAKPTKAD